MRRETGGDADVKLQHHIWIQRQQQHHHDTHPHQERAIFFIDTLGFDPLGHRRPEVFLGLSGKGQYDEEFSWKQHHIASF